MKNSVLTLETQFLREPQGKLPLGGDGEDSNLQCQSALVDSITQGELSTLHGLKCCFPGENLNMV